MNLLRERRQALGLTQRQVARKLREVEPRINGPMVSRYEQGMCLPTKEQLIKLEETLQASRSALYDAEDLALGGETQGRRTRDRRRREEQLHKCYWVPREFMAQIPADVLEVCGYLSWSEWHLRELKRLVKKYERRLKRKERQNGKAGQKEHLADGHGGNRGTRGL